MRTVMIAVGRVYSSHLCIGDSHYESILREIMSAVAASRLGQTRDVRVGKRGSVVLYRKYSMPLHGSRKLMVNLVV